MPEPKSTDGKAPPFTFFDRGAGRGGRYRAQITQRDGSRNRAFLRTSEGLPVREASDVPLAMAALLKKLIAEDRVDPQSACAVFYLGGLAADRRPAVYLKAAGRNVVAFPAPAPGWHGMEPMSIEVNRQLVLDFAMQGSSATKIMVAPGTPASARGLRTGDYVLSVGVYGKQVSLADFAALGLLAGTEVLVRYHRPGHHRSSEVETAVLKLRGRPGPRKPRWWQLKPKVACGREVVKGYDRAVFEAEMSAHPHITPLGFQILIRLLRRYDGELGAYPSYATLARDVGCRRRQTAIEHVQCLEWLGLVEILTGAGRRGRGGFSNRFVIRWPEGWPIPARKKDSADS